MLSTLETLFKLARYQMTTWGHPETTGNKKIDFYLSSKLVETEGYQEKYSEKVILSNLCKGYFDGYNFFVTLFFG